MRRILPRSKRTNTVFTYTSPFRSPAAVRHDPFVREARPGDRSDARRRGRAALRLPGAGAYPMVVDVMAGRRARGVGGADRRCPPDRALPRQSDAPEDRKSVV